MKHWLLAAAILLAPSQNGIGDDHSKPLLRPFLGVHVLPVPDEVRAQTELSECEGLMVDFVMEESPAHLAGIVAYDILTHLEDQKLLSSEQFSNLIKSTTIGQKIMVTLLRKGKPISVSAVLVASPNPTKLIPPSAASADLEKLLPDLVKALKKQPHGGAEGASSSEKSAVMSMADNDGTVEIQTQEGLNSATVKDSAGKVLFSGQIHTEEQRRALPADVLARISKLEQSAKAVNGSR